MVSARKSLKIVFLNNKYKSLIWYFCQKYDKLIVLCIVYNILKITSIILSVGKLNAKMEDPQVVFSFTIEKNLNIL